VKALVAAACDFFERYNRCLWRILSVIGSDPAEITLMYLVAFQQPLDGFSQRRMRLGSIQLGLLLKQHSHETVYLLV